MQSLQKTGSSEYGEVFIGTTGKKDLVMNVVRVVTGVKAEGCREDTLYTFLFDMCRKQTKGAPRSRIKDKNYDFAVELDKKGLSKRVCQIFAAQVGVYFFKKNGWGKLYFVQRWGWRQCRRDP